MKNKTEYQDFLSNVAEKYRRSGYTVIVEPKGRQLPGFLSGFEPDLVAKREGENVVVEIKRMNSSSRTKNQMKRIAQLVEKKNGWRFDLVYYSSEQEEKLKIPSKRAIEKNIGQARKTYVDGNKVAALLQAWSALEATANRAVETIGEKPTVPFKPEELLKSLAFHGFIEDEEFRRVSKIWRIRNQVAHGQLTASLRKRDFDFICDVAEAILAADLSDLEVA